MLLAILAVRTCGTCTRGRARGAVLSRLLLTVLSLLGLTVLTRLLTRLAVLTGRLLLAVLTLLRLTILARLLAGLAVRTGRAGGGTGLLTVGARSTRRTRRTRLAGAGLTVLSRLLARQLAVSTLLAILTRLLLPVGTLLAGLLSIGAGSAARGSAVLALGGLAVRAGGAGLSVSGSTGAGASWSWCCTVASGTHRTTGGGTGRAAHATALELLACLIGLSWVMSVRVRCEGVPSFAAKPIECSF